MCELHFIIVNFWKTSSDIDRLFGLNNFPAMLNNLSTVADEVGMDRCRWANF